MPSQEKTVGEVLDLGESYLDVQGIMEPRTKCELLLARLLAVSRLDLHALHKKPLEEIQLQAMRRGLKRLRDGEPVQHVLGETGFMDHVFKTDRRALIPRPETEILVNRVLQDKVLWKQEQPCIVDVGTGSGCIILSVAASKPHARYLAIDISEDALSLAQENAERLQLQNNIIFYAGELGDVAEPEMLDAIIANLPYIPTAAIERLNRDVRDFEPRMALDGGESGLDLIADLIADAAIVLKNHGKIFLEIGCEQGQAVTQLLQENGFRDIEVLQDLAGRDRVVCSSLSGVV